MNQAPVISDLTFAAMLNEFGMGQLKWMFRIVQTKAMRKYYGPNRCTIYRDAIYDRMISRKVRGVECEVWE